MLPMAASHAVLASLPGNATTQLQHTVRMLFHHEVSAAMLLELHVSV